MLPIIFINCSRYPFLDRIISGLKEYETRTRNTLGRFLGQRVLFAETGRGKPVVRCSAVIAEIIEVYTREACEKYLRATCIPAGSSYDWQPDTRKKVLYRLTDVVTLPPFTPPESVRHGRVWMEYDPKALPKEELPSLEDGHVLYRRIEVSPETGRMHAVWFAREYRGFDRSLGREILGPEIRITYDQARGLSPIRPCTDVQRLASHLGQVLLP